MENGCVLLPEWMEEVKSSTHGSQISASSLHNVPQGDRCLSGGGRRPCDGFPPPSLIGLMRNPNWTRIGLRHPVSSWVSVFVGWWCWRLRPLGGVRFEDGPSQSLHHVPRVPTEI